MSLETLRAELRELANPEDAAQAQRYFKTGPGEYAEGDRFLGLRVPVLRRLARANRGLPAADVLALLHSEWHEERVLALLLWVQEYPKATPDRQVEIHRDYLANTRFINNWDLVDCSAEHLVGAHLREGDRTPLDRLAGSESLWERRIAVLATFHYIKRGDFADTLRIAERLLGDRHDLVHKAVGWMLREIGERDRAAEEAFLDRHAPAMPRTMLRYAIERFEEGRRRAYLAIPRAQR